MTKFRFTYKNIENAFEAMLNNSNYETWYELFDRETFEAEFAAFIGTTENELWKHKAFVQWYNETAEELYKVLLPFIYAKRRSARLLTTRAELRALTH